MPERLAAGTCSMCGDVHDAPDRRALGFYLVRKRVSRTQIGAWEVAHWLPDQGWYRVGTERRYDDADFAEIGQRIDPPAGGA